MLKNFLFHICECEGGWSMGNYIDIAVENIREKSEITMSSAPSPAASIPLSQLSSYTKPSAIS